MVKHFEAWVSSYETTNRRATRIVSAIEASCTLYLKTRILKHPDSLFSTWRFAQQQLREAKVNTRRRKKKRKRNTTTAAAATSSKAHHGTTFYAPSKKWPPQQFAAVLPKATFKGSNKVQLFTDFGLPVMATKGKVRCSLEHKPSSNELNMHPSMVASMMTAVAAVMTVAATATAMVNDRLSTEGIGLPFGLSNNLLGWILFGVFGLVWALYFIYVSSLEEDDESGLSL
ncbi:photosystem II reaction center W protein, chloroplastic-like [Hibiscus syriacus]|uniref:photosystem II reaction center W protein, chloroplastic-like n=1 Tax=Hibiscus syriacus TaxID=106335 RepID=UPI001921AA5F|nr:photosystem II reaction center W protein, chloroplastic-like [Hibiscus syriacus]